MSEQPPRPQFGEYATPEQQAKAAGLPYPPPAAAAVASPRKPTDAAAAPPTAPQARRPDGRPYPPPASDDSPAKAVPALASDRFTTWLLIGFGLYSLATSMPQYFSFFQVLNATTERSNLGPYTLPQLASQIGVALAIVHSVLYLTTVIFAIRRMRRGRRAFWVPLVGALVFILVVASLVTWAYLADPSVAANFSKLVPPG